MEGAKTAPVDAVGSCHLAGTVYVGIILPLPAKRHPRQQRDHLQRPAQIAEIMHFPPRPDLSGAAADPGVMHAVRRRRPREHELMRARGGACVNCDACSCAGHARTRGNIAYCIAAIAYL